MDKKCKNCKHWSSGQCWGFKEVDNFAKAEGSEFILHLSVWDDSGLNYELLTGPDFFCAAFEA